MSITKQATCTADGIATYTCKNKCGDSYTKEISAIGHKWETETIAATCTDAGGTYKICSNCGDETGITAIKALGHSFGSWKKESEATCTTAELQKRYCTRCSKSETRNNGSALGHSYGTERTKYTAIGSTGKHTYNLTCTRCSDVSIKNESCSYESEEVWKYEWYFNKGTKYTCKHCGYSYTNW